MKKYRAMADCHVCGEPIGPGDRTCPFCGAAVEDLDVDLPAVWPQPKDFQDAVLNPQASFLDADLRDASVVCGPNSLPIPASGQFGIVYQMRSAAGQRWAVKCFTSAIPGRQERYGKIAAHLLEAKLPFTVGFEYLKQGVYINELWYPILKMEWVEGQTLNQFIAKRTTKPAILKTLGDMWIKLAQLLADKKVTHADLQHGNVMLVPSKTEGRVSLRLVDYDGMYLPSLANARSGEIGQANFQHPKRLAQGYYGPEVDRFSHLVIYTAMRGIMHKGQSLWQTYDDGNNLLFTQADFADPRRSKILKEFWQQGPDELRHLAGRLVLATQQAFHELPLLSEIVDGGNVAPLSPAQAKDVDRLLVGTVMLAGPPPTEDLKAAAWYRNNAEAGDVEAQFNIGWRYANGRGIPKDDAQAVVWYRKAAEQGHSGAQTNLGLMYSEGRGVPKDDAQAVIWYRKAADQGGMIAQFNLGTKYETGGGVPRDDAQAVHWYRKAAEQGHVTSQYNMAVMCEAGRGTPKDEAQAAQWYRKAAEQGHAEAQFNIGWRCDVGNGVPKDDAKAVEWYRKAAEQGIAGAQTNLAMMYGQGRGVAQDDAKAVEWYRKAAEKGQVIAQFNLGVRYGSGLGVPKDDALAVHWYRKAAEQGHVSAQYYLGSRLENGQGVAKDEAQAAFWYRKGAELGHAVCQYNLGVMLGTGQGIPRNDAEAAVWYRKAADQGHAGAQHNLGWRYSQGLGVPKDPVQAVFWYRKAAEQGDRDSQHNLGVMYANGEGVARSDSEAVAWYRKAAEQGQAAAQSNLGFMYENGRGVAKDLDQARYWYQKAADQGNVIAQNNLKRLQETKPPPPPPPPPPRSSKSLDDEFDEVFAQFTGKKPAPSPRVEDPPYAPVNTRGNLKFSVKIYYDPTPAARATAKEIERIAAAAGFSVDSMESNKVHDTYFRMDHHPSRADVAESLAALLRGVRHRGREIELKSESYVAQDWCNVWIWGN